MTDRNYITRAGFKRLADELNWLNNVERPRVTREVSDAAAEGDRSENAAYIYGKRRLREIDRRMGFLQRRLDNASVVDVKELKKDRILFGATVDVEDEEGQTVTYRIVGVDEVDAKAGKISWKSPVGHALLGKKVDDELTIRFHAAKAEMTRELVVIDVRYEEVEEEPWKPNATAWRPPTEDAKTNANASANANANASADANVTRPSAAASPHAPAGKKRPSGGTARKKSRPKS